MEKILAGIICVAIASVSYDARAAGNGCDNVELNDRVHSELALCSVHAYNIGAVENPEDETTRQLMRDVIGLKTTVMTQQMYKQYAYLETMIRRMKTQLEKAVLTTKLQAAGAGTDGSLSNNGSVGSYSSGGVSGMNDRAVTIVGAKNCNYEASNLDVLTCLRSNLQVISQQSANGTNLSLDLRKQLANDMKLADKTMNSNSLKCETTATNNKKVQKKCTEYADLGDKAVFQECLDNLNSCIRDKYEEVQKANKKAANPLAGS